MSEETPYEEIAGIKVIPVEHILEVMEPYIVVDPMDKNLDQIALRAGRAFSTAQKFYLNEARALEKLMSKKNQVELLRRRYYLGQGNPEMYRKEPLPHAVLKTEVDMWLKADDVYINICELVDEQKRKIKIIEQIFDRIKSMGFEVRTACDWRKYLDGN